MGFFRSHQEKKKNSETRSNQPLPHSNEGNDVLGNNYQVYRKLGHGGFGAVYLVYSHETKEIYALKTFKDEFIDDRETRELFRREANVWVDLESHPFIVRAFLIDEISGRLYIAIEYIAPSEEGLNSLEGYLESQPPDLVKSLRWAIQFCYGMEYAYSKGVRCHRDIKPANIMISTDKTVKITDFGLAGVLDASKAASRTLPFLQRARFLQKGRVGLSGSVLEDRGCGTPTHMPPEQFTKASACDQRSDIYSFGVVLYQMASGGKLPFLASLPRDDSSEEQTRFWREMFRLHSQAPVPKRNSPLFPMIQCALKKEPCERYQTFRELRADLEPLLKKLTGEVIVPPEPMEYGAWEWSMKGASLNNLGRFDDAIACFDQSLKINTLSANAWCNKGNSFNHLNRFEDAVRCYDQGLEINPRLEYTWCNKGAALNHLGRFEEVDCDRSQIVISEVSIT
jgi:serine/threonine protein kinase